MIKKADLSDIPMLTADGFKVRNKQILYTQSFNRFRASKKAEINAYRVIKIFPKERYFVYRCNRGCESTFYYNHKGSCSSIQMYAKPSNARKELKVQILERIKDSQEAILATKLEIKKLRQAINVKIGPIPK